ncbi:MAG: cadmium-translocating P-type ATPase [Candidatus Cloacimonadota bacterium]|nr:MAG: cadmium-translocating P-type ATPase [Candidatus Cloacimonadota bacterium]PIE77656.1 MAG: cadmium-translocating P-type ATPase [Candidatus Delongbacteria bacterium]
MKSSIKLNFFGVDCAGCAGKIEKEIRKTPNIIDANINFSAGTISIDFDTSIKDTIIETVNKIMEKNEPGSFVEDPNKTKNHTHSNFDKKKMFLFFISISLLIVAINIENINISTPIFIVSYLVAGFSVLKKATLNIKKGLFFDENFLMSIATIGAIILGEYPEAVAVMLFYKAGEIFQGAAVKSSRDQIKSLTDLKPDRLRVVKGFLYDDTIPENGKVGDLFEVRAGEKIALDGEIVSGSGNLETSSLTGESIERFVKEGDTVLSGMVNVNSVLKIKVTKPYSESTVKKILDIIENSSIKKSGTETLLNKFASYYTPIVVAIAVVIGVGVPFIIDGNYSEWIYKGLVFLVISCPCALVLSIPLTYFASIGRAAKEGILIKGSGFLDEVNRVGTVAFDKTGTLTNGEPEISEIKSSREEIPFDIIYNLEKKSTHPLSKVLISNALKNGAKEIEVEDFEEIRGYGLRGSVNGEEYYLGSKKYISDLGLDISEYKKFQVILATKNKVLTAISLKDSLKKDSVDTISYCNNLGLTTALISGDLKHIADEVSKELNIKETFSEMLPNDKVSTIENLQKKSKVLYFGDGINDAPVMTVADISVSMGKLGSDAAIEASNIVFMNDDIGLTKKLFSISKKNKKLIIQNISFILIAKISIMGLGTMGLSTLWQAVFADVGVALVAVLNSMRILKMKI